MKTMYYPKTSFLATVAVLLAAFSAGSNARANVYASNIKLDDNLSSETVDAGTPVVISYILNEPATLGATISILSGTNVVDTISIASGNSGTLLGTNSVLWGGTNSLGATVGGGTYSVSITVAASGYTNWTQITSDTNEGNYIYWPAGIAVDCNTNSPYYGRIMVCNSGPNGSFTNGMLVGDVNGIIKLNADGSFADEGQSDAGYSFNYDGILGDVPRRGRIAADDRFYFDDWSGPGKIVAVDMQMTENQTILDASTFTLNDVNGNWPDFDVTDVGTPNAKAYFSDAIYNSGADPGQGVWAWPITNNGAADPFDNGAQVIKPDGNGTAGTDIPLRSVYGLMLDTNNDVFIGEVRSGSSDPTPRASCITNWPSSTNQPLVADNILWQVGQSDATFVDISDLAIDSRTNPHYVSCTMNGGAGGMKILDAATGALVTNLEQNVNTFCLSTAWDNVGNVYAGNGGHVWQAFSPPGTNQATTVAVETIQVTASIVITSISVSDGTVTINFTADPSDSSATLQVVGSEDPAGGYGFVGDADIETISPGVFQATMSVDDTLQFYRIVRGNVRGGS